MDVKTIQHVFACYNATNFEENNFEVFEYSHNETFVSWYDKCRILDAYAHPAFRRFSKNSYKYDASNGITDTIIIPFLGAVGILGNIGGIISFFRKTTLTYYLLLFFLAILDSETTKENDTVFDITFDSLDCKCKEKGDQKEKENQTLSISAHKNRRRKRDFKCTYCSSVDTCLYANKQPF